MSDRKLDSKGRWRSRVVAFRVSDEEAELLNRLVDISGLKAGLFNKENNRP